MCKYLVFRILTLFCVFAYPISNIKGDLNRKLQQRYDNVIANTELYYQFKDVEKVIQILEEELSQCGDSCIQSLFNYELAMAYLDIGDLDVALSHIKKYKAYNESIGDSVGVIKADIALGRYYCLLNDIPNATSLLLTVLNVMPYNYENELKANAFIVLAEVNIKTNSFSKAKAYAQKAIAISNTINSPKLKLSCFNLFSLLYEKMGHYQSALYYKNKSVELQDSIIKTKTTHFVSSNEKANKEQLPVLDTGKTPGSKSNMLESGLFGEGQLLYTWIIVLMFVFALVFFILFRGKVVLSKKLKQKNRELENLNATKDKFFSIIAHDLKSPFNSLMGFSEVLSLQVENKSQKEIMEYSRSIHNSTRKLYSLVETLLQWSRTQLGTTEYKPDKIDIKILASNIVSILKINAEEKDIVISVNVEDNLVAWADKDLFSAVLRNLVSNAIKFSRVGSVVGVFGKLKGNHIEISVTDAGVGISKENLEKIFKVDSNVSTVGTLNEKGTGLGLVLCKEFVEINKGTISAESKLEKGSTFKFTVPLSAKYSLN